MRLVLRAKENIPDPPTAGLTLRPGIHIHIRMILAAIGATSQIQLRGTGLDGQVQHMF